MIHVFVREASNPRAVRLFFVPQNVHFAGLDLPRPGLSRALRYEVALWHEVSPIQDILFATSTVKKFLLEGLQISHSVGWVYWVSSPSDLVINV